MIRRLHLAEGESVRSIAAGLGVSRNTRAIRAMEPKIRALLKDNSRMPATVIAERVGWSGSPAWFRENVARILPEYAPADPADGISYEPGGPDPVRPDVPGGQDSLRARQGAGVPRAGPYEIVETSLMISDRSLSIPPREKPHVSRITNLAEQYI